MNERTKQEERESVSGDCVKNSNAVTDRIRTKKFADTTANTLKFFSFLCDCTKK